MALDTVDVRQSRAVKKTIFASSGGMTHRAGPVLDGVDPVTLIADSVGPCPATFDPATASAFCTFKQWHAIERQDRAADVSPMASGDVLPLAFVARPPNGDSLLEFDTYRGGADLKLADATLGADGAVTSVGNVRSALAGCAGLAGKDVDVRGPEWSYDGTKLVFAARPGAASGLDLWLLDVGAGGACRQLTTDGGRMPGPGARAQLRSGVRARRQRGVRVDARRDADAEELPAQRRPLPRRARAGLRRARADDLACSTRSSRRPSCRTGGSASPPRRRRPSSISCRAGA